VTTVLRSMLEGNKSSAERFINDMTKGDPKPTKFVELMTLLIQYHREILNLILKIETYENPRAGDSRPNSSFGAAPTASTAKANGKKRSFESQGGRSGHFGSNTSPITCTASTDLLVLRDLRKQLMIF
jgi:hypothetical protein